MCVHVRASHMRWNFCVFSMSNSTVGCPFELSTVQMYANYLIEYQVIIRFLPTISSRK